MTYRFQKEPVGFLTKSRAPRFTGYILTHPSRLDIPLRTRKPTVFAIWNDLFHEDVPDSFRDDAYAVMHGCDRHTYLILTKRADNLLRYTQTHFLPGYRGRDHIWHGLTVCNQQEADEKILDLLKVPGKKWLSIEPMLGPISLLRWLPISSCSPAKAGVTFDAVILGGETGPGARPMSPDWVRSVRDQCQATGVAFYFKQWGIQPAIKDLAGDERPVHMDVIRGTWNRCIDGKEHNELPWEESNAL
jgi:protein gp37